jgi:hypothetical protein
MSWPELRPGKFVLAFARLGVLPLSAGDLTRCFPNLWTSKAVADKALERMSKTTDILQINNLFGKCRLFFGEVLKAHYRRKGQRGPLACALVRSDLSAARAVLEGMVGELREFQVERRPEPPGKSDAPDTAPQRLPPLPPLAAALSAEGRLLASLPSDARAPDMLGMTRVIKLMTLAGERCGAERAAVA